MVSIRLNAFIFLAPPGRRRALISSSSSSSSCVCEFTNQYTRACAWWCRHRLCRRPHRRRALPPRASATRVLGDSARWCDRSIDRHLDISTSTSMSINRTTRTRERRERRFVSVRVRFAMDPSTNRERATHTPPIPSASDLAATTDEDERRRRRRRQTTTRVSLHDDRGVCVLITYTHHNSQNTHATHAQHTHHGGRRGAVRIRQRERLLG